MNASGEKLAVRWRMLSSAPGGRFSATRPLKETPPPAAYDFGVFARYRAQVASASEGAVLRP